MDEYQEPEGEGSEGPGGNLKRFWTMPMKQGPRKEE